MRIRLVGHKRLTFVGWYNTMPTWSPDANEIIYASYDKGDKRFDLFKMDSDGKNVLRLTTSQGNNEAPTWGPNGRSLIFHSNRKSLASNTYQLYIMNKDGSNQRMINTKLYQAKEPKWSY